jgi:hypothetical protein
MVTETSTDIVNELDYKNLLDNTSTLIIIAVIAVVILVLYLGISGGSKSP